jgi:hypothetical protein
VNIVFVCQKGELELKSILLTWSLRKSHGKNIQLYAAIPSYRDWADISEETKNLFFTFSVEIKIFSPIFGDTYPIGNKISALGLLPPNEPGCFLDSDMLSLSAWKIKDILSHHTTAAKPADLGTWGDLAEWGKVYSLATMQLPERRVRLTVSRTLSLPYFNAGFIATKSPVELATQWQKYAVLLNSESANIENKYPWLDQISLPIAMQEIGKWSSLTEYYNFPAHLRVLNDEDIGMCHYHSPNVILREPRLRVLFEAAVQEFPLIAKIAMEYVNWIPLVSCKMPNATYSAHNRNFLITGIPRSGTSYLTSLLDSQNDWLVINEPGEIFNQLQSRTDSSGLELYYAECRERILLGQPIANKIKDGKVIEDTAVIDQRESYHPQIARSDFWLGSKNTLAYMASMEYLTKLKWPIIAMVRNPLDTLASWRNTFSHLAEAKVTNLPVANPDFPAWSTWQRQSLLEIDAQSNAALRRVLLWRLLARTLLHYQDNILLWRYEDLTENPARLINSLNNQLKYDGQVNAAITSSRKRVNDYDCDEREMLMDLCATEITAFKYTV